MEDLKKKRSKNDEEDTKNYTQMETPINLQMQTGEMDQMNDYQNNNNGTPLLQTPTLTNNNPIFENNSIEGSSTLKKEKLILLLQTL